MRKLTATLVQGLSALGLSAALAACGAPSDIAPLPERDVQGPAFNDGNTPAPPPRPEDDRLRAVAGSFAGVVGPTTLSSPTDLSADIFRDESFTDIFFYARDAETGEDAALLLFMEGELAAGDHFLVESDAYTSDTVNDDVLIFPRACAGMAAEGFSYDEPPADLEIDVDEGEVEGELILSFSMTDLDGGQSRGSFVIQH